MKGERRIERDRLKLSTAYIIAIISLFLSLSQNITLAHASEPPLTEIFDNLGFTDVTETTIKTFPAGTYKITLYAEFAGYCEENQLSYYEIGTSTYNLIFTGPEGDFGYISPITKEFTANNQFGLSMLSPGPHRYFTETSLNPDGEQHAKVYQNLDDLTMLLIGFENLYGAGDRDYNDIVVSLCSNPPQSVGGVEVSTPKFTAKNPVVYYALLIAVLGAVISLTRRKRQR